MSQRVHVLVYSYHQDHDVYVFTNERMPALKKVELALEYLSEIEPGLRGEILQLFAQGQWDEGAHLFATYNHEHFETYEGILVSTAVPTKGKELVLKERAQKMLNKEGSKS
jgi:hypothetical protein